MKSARTKVLGSLLVATLAQLALCMPAQACGVLVRITYGEDYPDWFLVEFINGADFELVGLDIDLNGSVGSALIDTPYSQRSEQNANNVVLADTLGFERGSRRMGFKFQNFLASKSYSLSVDLDGVADQLENAELFGATAVAHLKRPDGEPLTLQGKFDKDAVVELGNRTCA